MTIKSFLDSIKGIKTLNELDNYVRAHLPACQVGTDVWQDADGNVIIDGEDSVNNFAEIIEDITGGIAYIRPAEANVYGRWFTVTV